MAKAYEIEAKLRRELERWPYVTVNFGRKRRHRMLTVGVGDRSRMLVYSAHPSCSRAADNAVATLRRILRELSDER